MITDLINFLQIHTSLRINPKVVLKNKLHFTYKKSQLLSWKNNN